ncbi:MAG: hypothetical protein AB8G05_02600 [Oligoflexales bacterium]
MILRGRECSLFITAAILTYFSFCSALAQEQAPIKILRCVVGKPKMLEQWMWGKEGTQQEEISKEGQKAFEIRDFHTKWPQLFDPKFKTLRSLKVIRRTETVELFNFQSYNYTENFEYHLKNGKIEYTQIFRDVGSNAQFYISIGSCKF